MASAPPLAKAILLRFLKPYNSFGFCNACDQAGRPDTHLSISMLVGGGVFYVLPWVELCLVREPRCQNEIRVPGPHAKSPWEGSGWADLGPWGEPAADFSSPLGPEDRVRPFGVWQSPPNRKAPECASASQGISVATQHSPMNRQEQHQGSRSHAETRTI